MFSHSVARFRTPVDYVDRKWGRIHLSFDSTIATGKSGAESPVRILNFSEGGFLMDCREVLHPGEIVELDLSALGKVQGRITWSDGGRAGGAFISPILANDLVIAVEHALAL